MKVRWGCPPRVLSPPPHRTQSWRPCLPGQPWASGWRSTDLPVPSPRGWTIGFSERGAAHNRALPRCLSSRRCMRSWRVCGWPLSRPEAARPPPPSSLPSMAEWPGGTRAFPRWRERSRCTCAHETPPLGGTVRVSRPRPASWQPLSRPKLTVLRARQPPPCTPWLSCRFTKPRRSNRCMRVVLTRSWCRSCARRLTSLYERRKSRRGPSGRRCPPWWSRSTISGSTWQRWRTSTRHDAPISQGGLFGDTVEGFAQQFSAVQQQTKAIQHILPRRDAPSTAAPGARPQSARRRGRPPVSSRAAPPQAESTHRPVRRASHRRAAPPASHPGPKSTRKSTKRPWRGQPGDVGGCSFSGDGENSAAPSPGGGPGGESSVSFCFCSDQRHPPSQRKSNFLFLRVLSSMGRQCATALPPHSRPRTILPVAKRVRFGDEIPPHAPLASPVRDPGSSVRMPQNAPPSVPSTPTPFHCTTTGTSIVPLEPLAQRLEAWLTLPSLSRWLTRTIRLGYAIQFARRPPKFNGVLETSVAVRNAPVLREEIAVLLAKDAIEPVPPAEMRQGFYSPYFIVPKKGGGLWPILDLRVLNRALHKLPFKMLTHRRMIKCIQPQDWFAAIDLKDAYFHVSILPRHRPFLRFAFEGRAWQYRVLPFGLSLSPRVFTKVVEGALTPLREVGVRILNYLDDWLILAQSREQLGDHRDLVLRHLSQLGLWVNWKKSKLSPVQRISFLGVELDSVSMTARLTEERAQAVLNCLSSFRGRNVVPLKQFQRLLGHMASAAAVTPLGLLHMRPLQHWLHSRVPRWAWRRGTLRVGISQQCRCSLSPWTDLAFLRAGVPLEQVSRHTVVTTDASSMGWGATCNGQAASGLWTGPRLLWHINCLELWAVHLSLRQFRPLLLGKHVLVRTDNTAAVSYINRLGGIRSHRMSQLACHLLLWSHTQFKSLCAVHIPGQLNRAADTLSRQLTFPGEWRLHPETIRLIWSRFGEAQVDLFASPESSHCQLYFSMTEGPLGTDALAHNWPRALRKYAFPPVSLLAQTLCKLREDEEQVLLVAPHWPTRTWFPELISLTTAPPWRIPLRKDLLSLGLGTIWHAFYQSWLDFRGAPLSRWTKSSWSSCLLRQRSCPCSLPSNRVGDLQAFSVSEECLVFGPVYSHVVLRPRPGYVPKVPTTALPRSGGEPASTALGGGRSSLSVAVSRKSIAHIRDPHPERQKLLPPPMRWRTVPLWQTSAELRAGRHRTPSQDSIIFALSQFLPVYWVSNGREELAGVMLAAPFPLTRGYERLFLPQFSSPDGEPWWNPPSTPGSQTGRSSLTPGPVLVLARPGLRSAPVLG